MGSDVATKSDRATLREAVDHRGSGDGAATSLVGMGLTDVMLLHKLQNKITTEKMLLRVVIMKDVASSRGDECQLYCLGLQGMASQLTKIRNKDFGVKISALHN
jgi:hypothetical protein